MWNRLNNELDKWADAGQAATFWWRDDDAVEATSELDRLIRESLCVDAPLLLAVIPLHVKSTLKDVVASYDHLTIAQHGYAHINHAPKGQGLGAWELGLHRGKQAVMGDLADGYQILTSMFGDRFIPVVVPPWNRIDSSLFKSMSKFGYRGVSAFGSTDSGKLTNGMVQANCHCDPIKWKGGPRFTGEEKSIAMVCKHLQMQRINVTRIDEPTGLLTHHLDMDEQSWQFVAKLGEMVHSHPAAKWCHPKTIFHVEK